jgi:hypothetical protein
MVWFIIMNAGRVAFCRRSFRWAASSRAVVWFAATLAATAPALTLDVPRLPLPAFADREASGQKEIAVRARLVPDDRVEIVVTDNGAGIAADDLVDIRPFRPGTSTKKNQGGTGFGLPTAYRYAVAHGGGLAIESARRKKETQCK